MGQEIAEKMILYPDLGFNYIGSISNVTLDKLRYHLKNHHVHLGTIREFKKSQNRSTLKRFLLLLMTLTKNVQ